MALTTPTFAEAHVEVDSFRIRYLEAGPSSGRPLVWLAMGAPEAVEALVLEGPAAILPMGRVYRQRLPNCNYVLVYDAGHEVGANRPEAFASLVGDFLERREAFMVTQTSSRLNP